MSALGFGIWIWVDMWQDDVIIIELKNKNYISLPLNNFHFLSVIRRPSAMRKELQASMDQLLETRSEARHILSPGRKSYYRTAWSSGEQVISRPK